jgi:uncharacterized membrane protein YciS (DUF1049 family)
MMVGMNYNAFDPMSAAGIFLIVVYAGAVTTALLCGVVWIRDQVRLRRNERADRAFYIAHPNHENAALHRAQLLWDEQHTLRQELKTAIVRWLT